MAMIPPPICAIFCQGADPSMPRFNLPDSKAAARATSAGRAVPCRKLEPAKPRAAPPGGWKMRMSWGLSRKHGYPWIFQDIFKQLRKKMISNQAVDLVDESF